MNFVGFFFISTNGTSLSVDNSFMGDVFKIFKTKRSIINLVSPFSPRPHQHCWYLAHLLCLFSSSLSTVLGVEPGLFAVLPTTSSIQSAVTAYAEARSCLAARAGLGLVIFLL